MASESKSSVGATSCRSSNRDNTQHPPPLNNAPIRDPGTSKAPRHTHIHTHTDTAPQRATRASRTVNAALDGTRTAGVPELASCLNAANRSTALGPRSSAPGCAANDTVGFSGLPLAGDDDDDAADDVVEPAGAGWATRSADSRSCADGPRSTLRRGNLERPVADSALSPSGDTSTSSTANRDHRMTCGSEPRRVGDNAAAAAFRCGAAADARGFASPAQSRSGTTITLEYGVAALAASVVRARAELAPGTLPRLMLRHIRERSQGS